MKNVNRLSALFVAATAVLFTINASAQEKDTPPPPEYLHHWRIGFGLNGGVPINDAYHYSLGADARLQYDITMKTSLAFTTGYTHLAKSGADGGFVPAKLGFKAFVGNQLYFLGEFGGAFGTTKEMGNSTLWAPGAGVAMKHIDISVRYENYSGFDTGQVSCRLAYGFKL